MIIIIDHPDNNVYNDVYNYVFPGEILSSQYVCVYYTCIYVNMYASREIFQFWLATIPFSRYLLVIYQFAMEHG